MKAFKRIGAIVLAGAMVLAMSTTAFAVDLEEKGEEGIAGNWETADTERVQGTSLNLKKEIVAYNPNNTTVHAPVITYTYTVTPATVNNLTVEDEDGDHVSDTAVTAPVKSGPTTGLVVTGTTEGAAGNATSATGTLVFTNDTTWTTAAGGETHSYDINLNFNGVNFVQPGVYRYQIAETISAASYDAVAMEDGENDILYLDVYVDGNLDIYGYVCMTANDSVDPDTDTKINGFVDGTAADNSDKYYTYDLVLRKDVVNDTYAATNTPFPFTVIFNNTEGYTSTFTIEQTVGTGSTGLATLTGLPTAWNGVALVKDGDTKTGTTVGDITLTGIPAGVDVDVYETNVATGVTYTVATSVNGGEAVTDNNVTWGSAPASAVAQTTKAAYESTKATVNTPKIAETDAQSVAITNNLLLISPTGVVLRIAPYALMLAAGLALLLVSRRRRHMAEEA